MSQADEVRKYLEKIQRRRQDRNEKLFNDAQSEVTSGDERIDQLFRNFQEHAADTYEQQTETELEVFDFYSEIKQKREAKEIEVSQEAEAIKDQIRRLQNQLTEFE